MSGTAYHGVQQAGISNLPSEWTLYDYTHWTTAHSGVQYKFVKEFVPQAQVEVACGHYHCTLSLDEMKLKSGLVFKSHTGVLSGFVNLGSCNCDIELMVAGDKDECDEDCNSFLAKQVQSLNNLAFC